MKDAGGNLTTKIKGSLKKSFMNRRKIKEKNHKKNMHYLMLTFDCNISFYFGFNSWIFLVENKTTSTIRQRTRQLRRAAAISGRPFMSPSQSLFSSVYFETKRLMVCQIHPTFASSFAS